MKVLFLLPYPLHQAPSQRFRIEAFLLSLKESNIQYHTAEFLDQKAWNVLYKRGSLFKKACAVIKGFMRRLWLVLFAVGGYDYVFVHREASPVGPPIFEWLLTKVMGKKLLFDFDDAIWLPNTSVTNRLASSVKCFWKTKYICKWAYKIAAGNEYLAAFAGRYNNNVVIIPTCVDTDHRFNRLKDQATEKIVIGWTGSHSTLPYLDLVYPILKKIEEKHDVEILIICNQAPSFKLKSLRFIFWKEATEIEDLLHINIGLMPLVQDTWSEGKCGFKIIQYLSLGIPAVASPVGVNKTIIEKGVNGFLSTTEEEWYNALNLLITDTKLRLQLGKAGREKIVRQYSVNANSDKFISLFS